MLQVDWIGEPGWTTGPDHFHPRQEERFEVLSGRLGLRVEGVGFPDGSVTRRGTRIVSEANVLADFHPPARVDL